MTVRDPAPPRCPRCQGPLIGRGRARLLVSGILMGASAAIALFFPRFWFPAIILFLAGAYLVAWATVGKALWCRQCKTFPTGLGSQSGLER